MKRLTPFPRLLAAGGLALALSACGPSLLLTGAGVATLVTTDKTVTGHAVSAALDRDCSFVRASRGDDFCAPDPYVMQTQYCYQTLGEITCYTRPDPQASDGRRVPDSPEPPLRRPALDLTGLDLSEVFGETGAAKEN